MYFCWRSNKISHIEYNFIKTDLFYARDILWRSYNAKHTNRGGCKQLWLQVENLREQWRSFEFLRPCSKLPAAFNPRHPRASYPSYVTTRLNPWNRLLLINAFYDFCAREKQRCSIPLHFHSLLYISSVTRLNRNIKFFILENIFLL